MSIAWGAEEIYHRIEKHTVMSVQVEVQLSKQMLLFARFCGCQYYLKMQ